MDWTCLTLAGVVIWFGVLLLPWRPWANREVLDGDNARADNDLADITALIPARNEGSFLPFLLSGLKCQGKGLSAVLVDNQPRMERPKSLGAWSRGLCESLRGDLCRGQNLCRKFAGSYDRELPAYTPVLRHVRSLCPGAAAVGHVYLDMTWTSAIRCWTKRGAEWKGRKYLQKP